MFENKYGKFITIILIILIILIIGVLTFLGFNVIKSFNIQNDAKDAAEKFENQFTQNPGTSDTNTEDNSEVPDIAPEIKPEDNLSSGTSESNKVQLYKGFVMVGTIEIPKTQLKCPVLERATSQAIEVAVGIYAGPGLNKVGNTVIAGHNYRNGTFFSDNKKLAVGDKIYITDTTGKKVTYIIYKTYTTGTEDETYINRDTAGRREISLTTCTDDTNSRLIVWAKAD